MPIPECWESGQKIIAVEMCQWYTSAGRRLTKGEALSRVKQELKKWHPDKQGPEASEGNVTLAHQISRELTVLLNLLNRCPDN